MGMGLTSGPLGWMKQVGGEMGLRDVKERMLGEHKTLGSFAQKGLHVSSRSVVLLLPLELSALKQWLFSLVHGSQKHRIKWRGYRPPKALESFLASSSFWRSCHSLRASLGAQWVMCEIFAQCRRLKRRGFDCGSIVPSLCMSSLSLPLFISVYLLYLCDLESWI